MELAYGLLLVKEESICGAFGLDGSSELGKTGGIHGPWKGAWIDSFGQLRVIRQEHHFLGDDSVVLVCQDHLLLPCFCVDAESETFVEVGDDSE